MLYFSIKSKYVFISDGEIKVELALQMLKGTSRYQICWFYDVAAVKGASFPDTFWISNIQRALYRGQVLFGYIAFLFCLRKKIFSSAKTTVFSRWKVRQIRKWVWKSGATHHPGCSRWRSKGRSSTVSNRICPWWVNILNLFLTIFAI